MEEQTSKNGCCKSLCPQGSPSGPPASPGGSPRLASGFDIGFFQITASQSCISEWVRFCVRPLRVESFFSTALWLSCMQALLAFKARYSGGSSTWCRSPGLGSLMWGLNSLLLGEDLCICDYPLICGSPAHGCGSCLYWVSTTPTHPIVVPSLYLQLQKIFSAVLLVVLIGSCSLNSCTFGVFVGGGELRVFLLCHLGHPPQIKYLLFLD